MTEVPGLPEDVWAWVCDLEGEKPSSWDRVHSNDVNRVYRLTLEERQMYLKIGPRLRREFDVLRWLEGRLLVPKAAGLMSIGDTDALLSHAVAGMDLALLSRVLPPVTVIERLAAALRALHAADMTDWPFGGTGLVLVHGDACLPNFQYSGDCLSGYLDIGDMCPGDPEVDLSAAVWSLQYNMGPGHGLAFLQEYGVTGVDEEYVERLRRRYETEPPEPSPCGSRA